MKKKKSYDLDDLVIEACDVYDNEKEHYDDEYDAIHEIADGLVPIYYYDIGQYASYNSWLMTEQSELCTEGNAHDQIQANIYEHIVEGINEYVEETETRNNENS